MTLLDLPDEILCMIAKEIPDNHRTARYQLATCSRRLYMVLSPILFFHVTLCGELKTPQIRHVSSFLHAVVRNPKLAALVEYLQLHCWETAVDQGTNVLSKGDDFEYDAELIRPLVEEAGDSCSDEEWNKWHKDVESGVTDAWLALLIPRLPRLRKISLVWPYGANYVPWMLREAATAVSMSREWKPAPASVFPCLEERYASWYDTEGGASSYLMHPFFTFPAMRRIGGYMLADDDDEDGEDESEDESSAAFLAPRSSTITSLDLTMCNCSNDFPAWIRSCKTLKSFRYSHGGTAVSDDQFMPSLIHEFLSLHKDTLESVWLRPDDEPSGLEDADFIGSFADFTALKHLHASLLHFAEPDDDVQPTRDLKDLFPPSLETLHLFNCQDDLLDWTIEQLENLIGSESVPSLKTLALEGPAIEKLSLGELIGDEEGEEKLGPLKDRCEKAGVSFHTNDIRLSGILRADVA